jgi:hypothetical protein
VGELRALHLGASTVFQTAKSPALAGLSHVGPGWIRTNDLGIKSPLLYQLSYRPFGVPV